MLYRILVSGVILAGSVLLSACQSGGSGVQPAEPPADAVRESELRAYCPPVSLRDGTAFYTTYERGGEGDPDRVIYLSSIAETTRACKYGQGAGSVTVAIAGKVVPGPKGRAGNVTLPIRIVMLRGTEVIHSQLYNHPVAVADVSGATQFVLTVPDIPVPGGIDRGVTLIAGFDEGGGR
ncbi:hypothetical protein [Chelativorans sp. AA-79]|uniref:hypothetical protein n=1 Tax=Chelativorans sp. AA-79 TaxID=3028735 RepID=UPI0023F65F8A|nr:hypothetical protein [Chelativorans sp. AA-79]WEX07814.1 hypothetical protein PVE73_17145 [Chelativorans sp. AA-79]